LAAVITNHDDVKRMEVAWALLSAAAAAA